MVSPQLQMGLLTATFGLGFAIISYSSFADRMGWPVGTWYRSGTSLIMMYGIAGVICSPLAALLLLPWWTIVVVMVGGFFVGYVLTMVLRSGIQIVAPIALLAAWVADILYVLP